MTTLKRLSIFLVIFTLLTTVAQAYYDPYIGRFTQRDPAEDGVNWYAYAENNPLKYVDPTGQFVIAIPPIILFGGSAITAVKVGSAVFVGAAIGWWFADQSDSPDSPSDSPDSPSESESGDKEYDSVEDFLKTAKPGKKTRTSKQYDKTSEAGESGWDKANDDFDRLVKDLGGSPPKTYSDKPGVRSSTLPDGRTINVRPTSSGKDGGKPTIQIDSPKTGSVRPPHQKVRYNTDGG